MKKKSVRLKSVVLLLCGLLSVVTILPLGVNAFMVWSVKDRILSPEQAAETLGADCILVLGCRVYEDGRPSDMLRDRLQRGISLYETHAAPKLLMSGDHGRKDYNEVGVMKQYASDSGVPSADIFMDHAGFSTYDSLYRTKNIFGAERIVIVTQKYHLPRALFLAKSLGLDAVGVPADAHSYRGQWVRDIRELLARNKDFLKALWKPQSVCLGDRISLDGNGSITDDEQT